MCGVIDPARTVFLDVTDGVNLGDDSPNGITDGVQLELPETVRYDVHGKGLMVGMGLMWAMGPCRTTACLMWNLLITRCHNQ